MSDYLNRRDVALELLTGILFLLMVVVIFLLLQVGFAGYRLVDLGDGTLVWVEARSAPMNDGGGIMADGEGVR